MKKLVLFLKGFFLDRSERSFVKHNRTWWRGWSCESSKNVVLVEETAIASSIVAVSYVANFLAKRFEAGIVAYSKKSNFMIPLGRRRIYKSFNAKFLSYSDKKVKSKARGLFESVYSGLNTKRDIEEIAIDGVPIGDLIYDTHLRKYLVPTIDLSSDEFKETLFDALCLYLYWVDYFDAYNVKSVIVSHCVYTWNAIILRVAVHRLIPVYQVTAQRVYYITNSHNYRAYNDFFDYPERFKRIAPRAREAALALAKERLDLRFAGHVGVDMHYSTMSAYTDYDGRERVVSESDKVKILIATHCFFDSPHPYGINLFPDFYEWLTFLGEISERTDYEWYIKTHPDFLPGNSEVIGKFIQKYKKFKLVDSGVSHNQLIDEGIAFALSVYGTIGFEYAAKGVPVINASTCNPHIAYNFNINPASPEEYEQVLLNLECQDVAIDTKKVYEYYYCRFIDTYDNWLYDDYEGFISSIGGHGCQVGSVSYARYLAEFSQSKHQEILLKIQNFIDSKDYCLGYEHLDKSV